jgi:hypothetical protein
MKDCAPKAARSLVVLGGVLLAAPAQAADSGNDFGKLSFGVQIHI